MKRPTLQRSGERGALAIILGFSLIMLFGLAAMAVDTGFAFTKKEKLQSAADAAALAGARGGISTVRATQVATDNGFTTGGGTTVTVTPGANQLTVAITTPQTFYFASGLGFAPRNITATAVAISIPMVPAILATGIGCGSTAGVAITSPSLTITGNVAAAGAVNYGASTVTNGDVTYGGCASGQGPSTVNGTFSGPVAAPADPYLGVTPASFTCTTGTLTSGDVSWGLTNASTGVYCSGGRLDLNWSSNITINATFVAMGDITFSGNTGTITGSVIGGNRFVAVSASNSACPSGQAINIGNNSITMNGSFYAPSGCINFSGNTMTINGSLIGSRVQVQAGNTSAINGPGGSSPGTAYLQQ
jgi:Flp pilus assembly protein TadG